MQQETYKFVGHSFVPLPGAGKQWCPRCCLIGVNNEATRWCIDKGCMYRIHPQFPAAMKRILCKGSPFP